MAGQRHGVENVGFTKKDIHNLVNRKRRLKLKNGDASAMLEYFDRMTVDNQNFFHMHRVDHKGRLKDIMWVDARSREAYQYFGDVVCFDSTYLTNQYELPFSNFVGVNHHGQTILLGCALVSHENAETFEWLFKTWLSCMRGKRPAAIMTDQDAAMRKAIRVVFPMPETRHRWCMWHIMKKFGTKLGALSDYQDVKDALQHVIYNSITPDEFVESWWEVVNKFKLEQYDCYEWLEGLYEEREMWIPAYVKGVFWAGMQTTQRVESINSFFYGYINRHTRLYEFAPNYCKAMESRANDEQEADANCARFVRPLISEFSLERKFQKVYTDAKFVEVQNQCNRVAYLTLVSKKSVSHNEEEYVFSDRVWIYCKKKKKETPLKGR
ncbi:protein FAR-RED IMPAIRED RESPONSE 1-like [Chenopodium quinoa]|uniref:protein FAR-RED IMPAIRED RESPONSE 1-like n=1 Tax=Chenopodium quinoa TaxID=63459 RepID=UPI000B790FAD|nr:protein FAR-RED IMPAIRED RESPONSE 1-like [Chenopodium quinoa]